jgi:hypothetical protein
MADVRKLEALAGITAQTDAQSGPTDEQGAQQPSAAEQAEKQSEDGAREWGIIAYTIGGALAMLAPELRGVYTEEACLGWGRAMVPVAEKYGWDGPGNIPELGLVLATIGLAAPSIIVLRARLAAIKKARPVDVESREVKPDTTPKPAEASPDGGAP